VFLVIKEDANLKMDYSANAASIEKELENDIDLITKSLSRPYFNTAIKKLARENPNNAQLICDYILTEQTGFNIKDSTKEGMNQIFLLIQQNSCISQCKTRNT
jgi:hypothetical protein